MPLIPGVDEAVMSRYPVLMPAAWQDFATYMRALARWPGVWWKCHGTAARKRAPPNRLGATPGGGRVRCREGRSGFRFPWCRRHCVGSALPGVAGVTSYLWRQRWSARAASFEPTHYYVSHTGFHFGSSEPWRKGASSKVLGATHVMNVIRNSHLDFIRFHTYF